MIRLLASHFVAALGGDGDRFFPCGGLIFEAAFSVIPEVTHDDLMMPAKGMASSAPRIPASSTPNQDRHNHCQRIEFDCPGQDEWLQNMVLQLLICHKEDGDHDECWDGVKAAAVTATIAPRVAPMSGMRSAIPTNMAIRPAKGTPMIFRAA